MSRSGPRARLRLDGARLQPRLDLRSERARDGGRARDASRARRRRGSLARPPRRMRLLELTEPLVERYEVVREVRGLGLIWAIEFGEPSSRRRPTASSKRLQRGIFAQFVVGPLFRDHQVLSQVAGHAIPSQGAAAAHGRRRRPRLVRARTRRDDREGRAGAARGGGFRADRRADRADGPRARCLVLRSAASLARAWSRRGGNRDRRHALRSEPGPLSTATRRGRRGTPVGGPTQIAGGRIATPETAASRRRHRARSSSRRKRCDALGFAVVPGRRARCARLGARALPVRAPAGSGSAGRVRLDGGAARPCGAGCYQNEIATGAAGGNGPARHARLRVQLPLPATARRDGACQRMRRPCGGALKTLVWHERLAGSPTDVIHTVYVAVAPDELSYTITGLSAAIIIGGTAGIATAPRQMGTEHSGSRRCRCLSRSGTRSATRDCSATSSVAAEPSGPFVLRSDNTRLVHAEIDKRAGARSSSG